jgi:hypothetical protein
MYYTGYFTRDNDPDGIEDATHNTFAQQTWTFPLSHPGLLWKRIVGCILNCVGFIITREIPVSSEKNTS